jgi:large subunit ribosomal protein L23
MKEILVKPLVTEKMTALQDEHNQYAFEVSPRANKIEIAYAIQKKFNVKVVSIRTVNLRGKSKTQLTKRGRFQGETAAWKKAIVTLKEGEKIDFFANT